MEQISSGVEGYMKTLTLRVEDSAIDKVLWFLEHLKDVVTIDESSMLESELLEDLAKYKSGRLKTTEIENIESYMAELKHEIAQN